jgi:hypothetical protein
MNRSVEDLLTWGENCNVRLRDTDIYCLRNEHGDDTPHQNGDVTWWNNQVN